MDRIDALIARLGVPIRDRAIIAQALTHSSWLHEHPDGVAGHNERLEFLGDAVISIIVSQELYRRHPSDDEGLLSSRRAAIVSTTGLADIASRIGIGEALRLGEGEASRGGRVRPSLLASGLEALVGAVFLDLGWDAVAPWFAGIAEPELTSSLGATALKSPKSRLQEWTQHRTGARPEYRVLEAAGPDHEKVFRIDVMVEGASVGTGLGPSRRIAETNAAAEALITLTARDTADAADGDPA
ncbi:MAG: ribonuclease III [Chloroflexi bacterium]|nr:ribonuclease III [Chloroflexota bacterium]